MNLQPSQSVSLIQSQILAVSKRSPSSMSPLLGTDRETSSTPQTGSEYPNQCSESASSLSKTKRDTCGGPHRTTSSKLEDATRQDPYSNLETEGLAIQDACRLTVPLVLQPTILGTFALSCVILMVGMAVVFGISKHHNGLATVDDRYYYALETSGSRQPRVSLASYGWTYGPTLIFTLLVVYWSQVDYQIMPWKQMAKEQSAAERSVLVDYISPSAPVVMYESLRASHFLVFFVSTGSILIALMVVLSTGLFVVANIPIENIHTSLVCLDKFVPNGIGLSTVDDDSTTAFDGLVSNATSDDQAAITVNNLYAYNSTLPFGTTEKYAYPRLSLKKEMHQISYTGEMDVFHVDLKCESVNATIHVKNDRISFLLADSQCNIILASYEGWSNASGDSRGFGSAAGEGFIQCEGDNSSTTKELGWRFAFAWIDFRSLNHGAEVRVLDGFYLLCEPRYEIGTAIITMTPESLSRNRPESIVMTKNSIGSGHEILTPKFGAAVQKSIANAANTLPHGREIPFHATALFPALAPDSDWNNITHSSRPDQFNTVPFEATYRKAHNLVSVQVAKRYFMEPTESDLMGSSVLISPRLFFRGAAFWIIESILLCSMALSIFLLRQSNAVPLMMDSSPIHYLAIILSRSPSMVLLLSGAGNMDLPRLRKLLSHTKFRYRIPEITSSYSATEKEKDSVCRESEQASNSLHWFRPFHLGRVARVVLIVIPVVVLLSLEATYRYSKENSGLSDIDQNGYAHYSWTYIPALTLVTIGLLSDGLSFSVKLLSPYYGLHKNTVRARGGLLVDYLGMATIRAIVVAIREQHLAVVMAALASSLAPTLTIVVGGVFSPFELPQSLDIPLLQVETFSPTNLTVQEGFVDANTMPGAESAMNTAQLILNNNLNYPRWTHDALALPRMVMQNPEKTEHLATWDKIAVTLKASVPAIRAVSNCSLLPDVLDDSVTSHRSRLETFLYWNIPNISEPYVIYSNPMDSTVEFTDGYFGWWFTERLGVPGGVANAPDIPPNVTLDFPPDFPHAIATFGEIKNNITTNLTNLYCKPYLEQVSTTVEFLLPSFDINPAFTPIPDESTAIVYPKEFPAIIGLESTVLIPTSVYYGSREIFDGDGFSNQLCTNAKGEGCQSLVGADNIQNLISSIEHLYGIYMAQLLNYQRKPQPSPTTLNGTVINPPHRIRIQQNEVSTRILQVLLGIMAVLMSATYFLFDAKELIPKNPCSIAAVASLLADSELLGHIRTSLEEYGSEDQGWEKLEKKIFEGLVLSMGWWGEPENKWFGINVGQSDSCLG